MNRPSREMEFANEVTTAAALQMCSYLHILLLICHLVPLWTNRNPKKRKRQPNEHRDRSSVIQFIHTWSDDMLKQQLRLPRPDFFLLQHAIFGNMTKKGYDLKKNHALATNSSGSPITLELRLYVTLCILSSASYLDMIWYGVEIRSVPVIFGKRFASSTRLSTTSTFQPTPLTSCSWLIIGQLSVRIAMVLLPIWGLAWHLMGL